MLEYKITAADLDGRGVRGLADTPRFATAEMQRRFDEISREVLTPKFNALVDKLDADFATKADLANSVHETGNADMAKAVYDADLDGTVDDAARLGGNTPAYYAQAPKRYALELSAVWTQAEALSATTTVTDGSAALAEATFKAAVSGAAGTYVFTYVSANGSWRYGGADVSLSAYGVTLTGTPADANTVTVTYTKTAPYTQTVAVSGLLASDKPHVAPAYSADNAAAIAQREAWACVSRAEAGADALTFTCFEDKPETAIPVQIEVMR